MRWINQRGDFYSEANDPIPVRNTVSGILGAGTGSTSPPATSVHLMVSRKFVLALGSDPGGTSIEKGPDTAATTCVYTTKNVMLLRHTPRVCGT